MIDNKVSISLLDTGFNHGDIHDRSSKNITKNMHRVFECTLQCRYNEDDGVSDLQPHDRLFKRLFRRRSKETSKLLATGLRAGNSSVTGEFLVQIYGQ